METNFEKVSVDHNRIVVDLKRKRGKNDTNAIASGVVSPLRYSATHKLEKKRKVEGGLRNYYMNFMKSGIPKRVMYYRHGAWVDFPEDTLGLVQKTFHAKNGMVEIKFNGELFCLDFLHMIQLDMKTGLQNPIAWIDETDRCYFPETFSNAEIPDYVEENSCNNTNIKLLLEIEINGENNVSASFDLGKGHLDGDAIREIFYKGIHLRDSANIVAICRGLSNSMKARYELFLKQIEITQRYRGDSNVQYAWLPSSKKMTSFIMKYGLGSSSLPSKIMPVYGYGVYLIPANCTELSAKYCDIDENGVRNMILCRVIMGNMELVSSGSKQFHPSSEEFDSGIDDLQNPKQFIVWNMNASTHIFPEYVVSFQLSSDPKVFSSETANSNLPVPEVPVHSASSSSSCVTSEYHHAPVKRSRAHIRVPKSPWISVPELFAAISNEIPEKVMNDVKSTYELYKSEKINREGFVRNLRLLVGDPLLRAMLTKFQRKAPTKAEIEQMEKRNLDLKLSVNNE